MTNWSRFSVVPTDFDLNVLDEGIDYVIKPSQAAVDQKNDFVRRMHTHSGLINEWEHGLDVAEAESKVIRIRAALHTQGVRPLLAGNSVGSDKKFLDRYMPGLMEYLHYPRHRREHHQGALAPLVSAVYNHKPAKHGGHRALADIIESIDELRYYRDLLFVARTRSRRPGRDRCRRPHRGRACCVTYERNGNPLGE